MDYLYLNSLPSVGKKREDMPQIDLEFLPDLILHFIEKGVQVKRGKRMLKSLKPIQVEFNEEKILKKIQTGCKQYLERRYLLSSDGFLLDANHDWAHGIEQNQDQKVNVIIFDLPIDELVKRTNKLKLSYNKGVIENLIESAGEDSLLIKGEKFAIFSQKLIRVLLKKGFKGLSKLDKINTKNKLFYVKKL